MPIGIIGLGAYIPDRVVTNAEVASWAGTTEDWILDGTGVSERRYAADDQVTSDLALEAAKCALAGRQACLDTLGAIVLATSTPDQPQPATAAILQHKLGLAGVPSFDVNAVCSGFLYAMATAEALLSHRMAGSAALVIGADKYSTIMNPRDRRTVSLFGDAAGAVVLGEVPEGFGIRATELITDGQYSGLIEVPAGGTRRPSDEAARAASEHLFMMNGFVVREYVLKTLPKAVCTVLADAGLTLEDVDRFVFHQANTRLVESCARELDIPMDRVPLTAPTLGNTAVASIPVTLAAAHSESPLQRGEKLVLASVGGGMSTAATLLIWY